MYIGKGINKECIAETERCKAIPSLGHNRPKLWDQMNATNDGLSSNDAGGPLSVLH